MKNFFYLINQDNEISEIIPFNKVELVSLKSDEEKNDTLLFYIGGKIYHLLHEPKLQFENYKTWLMMEGTK